MAEAAIKLSPSTPSAGSDFTLWRYQLQEPLKGFTPWWAGVGQNSWVISYQPHTEAGSIWAANIGTGVCVFEWPDAPVRYETIEQSDLPVGERYQIRAPIPVRVTREEPLDFTATFDEAGISIGGESFRDAFEALVNEILDTFDYLTEHQAELGAEPQRQLTVLRTYLGKTND